MEEKYNFVSFSRLSYTQNKLGHTTFWMTHTPTGLSESVQKSNLFNSVLFCELSTKDTLEQAL